MKICRLRLLNVIGCAVVYWFGLSVAMAADNMRFLLLIDHSPDMATRQIATAQTVFDLVRSGFQNQIQPGEQFALWFYGSRLQTNAPFIWQPGREVASAQGAANLFGGRIYSRLRPREQTLADAAPIIAASPKVTILIFTEASQPIAGTPYDAAINSAIEQRRDVFRQADKPMIITLLAKKGQLIGGTVHTNVNKPFQIPDLEHPPELMDKALAAMRTAVANPGAKATEVNDIDKARDAVRDALSGKSKPTNDAPAMQFAPTLKEIPKETAEIKKEEIKKEEPKEEKPVSPAVRTPNFVEQPKAVETSKVQEQKIESQPAPVAPKPVEVAAAPVVKEPEPKAVVVTPQPQPIKEPVKEEPKPVPHEPPKVVETPKPAQAPTKQVVAKVQEPTKTTRSAAEPNPVAPKIEAKPELPEAPIQTATVTSASNGFPWLALIGGLGAISALGAIALMNVRKRAKSAGSIITQALPRAGLPPPK
jgi:hypothetical protein